MKCLVDIGNNGETLANDEHHHYRKKDLCLSMIVAWNEIISSIKYDIETFNGNIIEYFLR